MALSILMGGTGIRGDDMEYETPQIIMFKFDRVNIVTLSNSETATEDTGGVDWVNPTNNSL